MGTTTATVPATIPTDLRNLARAVSAWLRANLLQAAISVVIGATTGWVANVLLMGMVYDGYTKVGRGPVTGEGNVVAGSLIWGIGSTLVFGLFGYWRAVGNERFGREIRDLPRTIGRLLQEDGPAARGHFLWGVAMSLVSALVVSPWLGAVVAAALATTATSPLSRIASKLLDRAWTSALNLLAPGERRRGIGPIDAAVGLLGSSAALAVGFFIDDVSSKVWLGLACAIAAWILSSAGKVPPVTVALAWVAILALLIDPTTALGHDGGTWEQNGLVPWVTQGGPLTLLPWAFPGGLASGVGAPIGLGLGHLLGGLNPGVSSGAPGSAPGSGTELVNPWTNRPLTRWEPGRFGPGEDGNAGGPGQVWFGGNWVDPATAREQIAAAQDADRRRTAGDDAFAEESRRRAEAFRRERARQLNEEAQRERAGRAESDRRQAFIDRVRDRIPPEQWGTIDRIVEAVNRGGPTPENVDIIRRLTRALSQQDQARNDSAAAAAGLDADRAQQGRDIAEMELRGVRAAAQGVATAVEATMLGSPGLITNFVFGAAGSWDKGPGTAVVNGIKSAELGFLFGAAGSAAGLPAGPVGGTLVGVGFGAAGAALQGGGTREILEGGVLGGVGGLAGTAAQGAMNAGDAPPLAAPPPEEVVRPGGPRPYLDAPGDPLLTTPERGMEAGGNRDSNTVGGDPRNVIDISEALGDRPPQVPGTRPTGETAGSAVAPRPAPKPPAEEKPAAVPGQETPPQPESGEGSSAADPHRGVSQARLQEVRDYLDAHPGEKDHHYINLETKRVAEARNSGQLTPGEMGDIYTTASGSGPAGYLRGDTLTVRIPRDKCTYGYRRDGSGTVYDMNNKPIPAESLRDRVVLLRGEGAEHKAYYVDPDGKFRHDIPASKLERWSDGLKQFVPLVPDK